MLPTRRRSLLGSSASDYLRIWTTDAARINALLKCIEELKRLVPTK
jgi:hypothetical protein